MTKNAVQEKEVVITMTEPHTTAATPSEKSTRAEAETPVRHAGAAPAIAKKRMNASMILIAGLLIAAIAAWGCMQLAFASDADGSESGYAVVTDGQGEEHRFPLGEDGTYPIETDLGTNVISIEHGEVHMDSADCPGHDCIDQGAIGSRGEIIVCLPHKLIVNIEGGADDDAPSIDGMAS